MIPPKGENDYTMYCRDPQLGYVPMIPGVVYEITVPEGALTLEAMSLLQTMEFTVHIKTPKRYRCRSRKRFIRLMMSEGISRNYAERLADFVRGWVPYGEVWRRYLRTMKFYSIQEDHNGTAEID